MRPDWRFLTLLSCFVLSGFAGLVYQTAWTRQFAAVFGTSELALVTVLAAYMAGLALGAAIASRWVGHLRRPVWVYAWLELGIGGSALAVPGAIGLASRLQVVVLGGDEGLPEASSMASALFHLSASSAILLVPTTLMGATLPLLASWAVQRESQIAPRIGALYTANTAGAAAGAMTGAFVLLPRVGLGHTVLIAAAVNGAVFLLAAALARGGAGSDPVGMAPASSENRRRAEGFSAVWILPLVFLSGAVSFTWEILWTRLLSQILAGTVQAFATMLATFLVGIALGSLAASRLGPDRRRARRGFAIAQLGVAGLSLLAFVLADRLPALGGWSADGGALVRGVVLSGVTLLPAAVAIGASYPLAVRVLARDAKDAPRASARVLTFNTSGAIAGAVATGYWALPALEFAGTAVAAASLSLALAMAASLVVRPRLLSLAAAAAAGLAALAVVRPPEPWRVLRQSPLVAQPIPGAVAFYGVGRSATVLLTRQRREWRLSTNGLPESAVEPPWGRPGRYVVARWLSLLPVAARPEALSLLVVGLGAGVTVEDVPPSIAAIDVVELEPEVVRANQVVGGKRRRDPLADRRLKLYINDARSALRLSRRTFDAIVSQPSHPWTSGASHLYTLDFFALVKERLSPGGVFVQWMGLEYVDEALLRSLVATLVTTFPHVELYQPVPGAVLLLASGQPLDLAATTSQAIAAAPEPWAQVGVLVADDVLAARILDAPGAQRFAAGGRPNTDARNRFMSSAPNLLPSPLGFAGTDRLLAPFDALPASAGQKPDALYLVRRLIRTRSLVRARRLAETLPGPSARTTGRALIDLASGRRRQGETALRRVLELDLNDGEALAGLMRLYRPRIAQGQPVFFASLLGEEPQSVVAEGWRLVGAGDWRGGQRLDRRLADIEPHQPLFAAAVRLRAAWRIGSDDPTLAREAVELLEPRVAILPQVEDLILRAEAAAKAGQALRALSELSDAVARLRQPPASRRAQGDLPPFSGGLLERTLRVLRSLPEAGGAGEWRAELLAALERSET